MYVTDGRLTFKFVYNVLGIQEFRHGRRRGPPPRSPTRCGWSWPTTVAVWPRAGDVTLYHDGEAVGSGRVEATQAMVFSADETTDVGYESGTTVSPDYSTATSRFTGKIGWIQIYVGDDDHDHLIDPEERHRIAMARQ